MKGLVLLCPIVCYLIGSVNLSIVVSRALGRDVRESGSGNAGSTNMLRTFGWRVAIPVFLGDVARGALAVGIGAALFSACGEPGRFGAYLGAIAALLGHAFPVFFRFRGGKGVAVSIGAMIAIYPIPGALLLLAGFGVAAATKYVSLGSVLGAAAFPFLALARGGVREFLPALLMSALVLWLHRENIRRLREHRENKFTPPAAKS